MGGEFRTTVYRNDILEEAGDSLALMLVVGNALHQDQEEPNSLTVGMWVKSNCGQFPEGSLWPGG